VGSLVGLPRRKVEGVRLIEADVLIVKGKNELPARTRRRRVVLVAGPAGQKGGRKLIMI